MRKQLLTAVGALTLSVWAAGCATDTTTNTNTATTTANANVANANAAPANANTATTAGAARTAPDDSEIVTTEQNGTKIETRTFRNNPRVSRVVVRTEPSGRRTARVYTRDNQERELPEGKVESALDATGDAIVSGAGFVVDKSKDVGGAVVGGTKTAGREAGDKLEDVGGAVVDGAKTGGGAVVDGTKTVGREAGDKLEDAGGAVKKGAKKAGSATVKGAKKAGGAIKDAVTP
ncbi:MAG: hypothetical protein ACRD9R_23965 [Pyrinomonadaceae bacterium]